jgi:hypothetical protein
MYGATRSYYGSGSSETVPLPSGMGPGAVIGRAGSNAKMLGQRTGARFDIRPGCVVVSGTPAAVAAGVKILKEQILAWQARGGGYPHPLQVRRQVTVAPLATMHDGREGFNGCGGRYNHVPPSPTSSSEQVHYLLDENFGTRRCEAVFQRAAAEVAGATDRHDEALFHLAPSSAAGGGRQQTQARQPADAADELAAMLAGAKLLGSSRGSSGGRSAARPSGDCATTAFLLQAEGGVGDALRGLLAALGKGCGHSPAFNEIKLRFNWGKALFYRGPYAGEVLGLAALQARSIPDDFKSVYSNGVAAGRAADVVARLRAACPGGLVQVGGKQSASLHVLHRRSNAGYAASMIRAAGGRLELRKIKCATSKLFFLTRMSGAGGSGGEDWRAKLLGMYSGAGVPPALADRLRELAPACRLAPGGGDLDAASYALLHSADLELGKLRIKSKSTFEGWLDLPSGGRLAIKVSVSLVSGPGGCRHTEVGGCSPDFNSELAAALAAADSGSSRLAPERAARLQEMAAALLAFAGRVSEAARC